MNIVEEPEEIIEEAIDQLNIKEEQKQIVLEIFEWVKRVKYPRLKSWACE